MSKIYDPAKVARSPEWYACKPSGGADIVGPGGRRENVENDEKGILETALQGTISMHRQATLGSDHDSYRQGIYRTNSAGDRD